MDENRAVYNLKQPSERSTSTLKISIESHIDTLRRIEW